MPWHADSLSQQAHLPEDLWKAGNEIKKEGPTRRGTQAHQVDEPTFQRISGRLGTKQIKANAPWCADSPSQRAHLPEDLWKAGKEINKGQHAVARGLAKPASPPSRGSLEGWERNKKRRANAPWCADSPSERAHHPKDLQMAGKEINKGQRAVAPRLTKRMSPPSRGSLEGWERNKKRTDSPSERAHHPKDLRMAGKRMFGDTKIK
jgi:hypothetical protein